MKLMQSHHEVCNLTCSLMFKFDRFYNYISTKGAILLIWKYRFTYNNEVP